MSTVSYTELRANLARYMDEVCDSRVPLVVTRQNARSAAWNDYQHWLDEDRKVAASVNALIRDIRRDPFRGIGKPEPLKHDLKGWWSRRITGEHRLVYRAVGTGDAQRIEIASCRYHY